MKDKCIELIKNFTGKKFVRIVNRGNSAILLSLAIGKMLGYKKVLYADQGRWMTYPKYPKKLGLEVKEIKTDNALINPETLESDSVLIYTNLGGYFAANPVENIYKEAKKKNILVINDTCVLPDAKLTSNADIIIGSFGEWKVVDNNYGGFIAADNEEWLKTDVGKNIEPDEMDWNKLYEKLINALERLNKLYKECEKVKNDLKDFDIVHRASKSLVVIVRFKDEKEKNEIIHYCKDKYEYTECPREIRINEDAISIEIKRL